MIFSCVTPKGKCEWRHLIGFVNQFNTVYGKAYTRSLCLDIENRNTIEPELLLEAHGEIPIVIEHKSVAWPSNYFSAHRNEHNFFDRVVYSLKSHFNDSVYQLSIHEKSLKGKNKRETNKIAEQIVHIILSNKSNAKFRHGIGSQNPIPWKFRPLSSWEKDETTPETGVGVEIIGPIERSELLDFRQKIHAAKVGYSEEFERLAKDAGKKFTKYVDCQKILLTQFFGDISSLLDDEDIIGIIQSAQLPSTIDQVWVAQHDWVSEYDYEIAWVQVI